MPTLTFTKLSQCASGGHANIRASDGTRQAEFTVAVDEIRGAMTVDDLERLFVLLLRIKAAGMTRGQLNTALTAGVSIVI